MHKNKHIQYYVTVFLLFIASGLVGCSGPRKIPRHEAHWSELRTGMSKEEVVCLLGEPSSKSDPMEAEPNPDYSPLENAVGSLFVKMIFDSWFERWHYGESEMFESLLSPSDKAYVVYFGSSGKVVSFRKPIRQGSKGECRSPYYYRDISDSAYHKPHAWSSPLLSRRSFRNLGVD